MQADFEKIIDLAKSAGQEILTIYERDFKVQEKDDHSPLTEADLASHHCIVDGLRALTPELPVLSEESKREPYTTRSQWRRYWLVDPLDGTREFVKRNGEFTVNIALIEDQAPVFGVVHVPVSGQTYVGQAESRAFLREADGRQSTLRVTEQRQDPARVVGSRSHAGDSLQAFLRNLGPHQMVGMGSSLKLCLVAAGRADIYPRLGPTAEWDTAAAQAVVEAAGGLVTDTDGQALRYNTKDSLKNPFFLVFGDKTHDWRAYLGERYK